jgi:hypothetical protein
MATRRDEASYRVDGFGTGPGERDLAMELTGAAAVRRTLASASLAAVPAQRRRRAPSRVACVGRGCGAFADEAHLRYYEGEPRKAVEAAARDLSKLRAMGLVAGDAAKEKILSVSPLPPSSPIDFVCASVPHLGFRLGFGPLHGSNQLERVSFCGRVWMTWSIALSLFLKMRFLFLFRANSGKWFRTAQHQFFDRALIWW